MNKKLLLLYIIIGGSMLFVLSCSEDKDPEPDPDPPTTFKVIDRSNEYLDYFLVYYDSDGKCRLINEEGESDRDIFYTNFSYTRSGLEIPLPEDKSITALYILADSIVMTRSFVGYYRSFRLDTVYRIKKNALNEIKIPAFIKRTEIDRQNPLEYPELIKDVLPSWTI